MKTIQDFHEKEFELIDHIVGLLNDKGFDAEIIENFDGNPTAIVHLLDEENKKVKYFCMFDFGNYE